MVHLFVLHGVNSVLYDCLIMFLQCSGYLAIENNTGLTNLDFFLRLSSVGNGGGLLNVDGNSYAFVIQSKWAS